MKLYKYTACAALACLLMTSCGKIVKIHTDKDKYYDSSDFITKELSITEGFNAIKSEAITDVEYVPGPAKLTLKATENLLSKIEVYVKDSVLVVTAKDDNIKLKDFSDSKLIVSYPDVRRFETYGTGDFIIKTINTDDITFMTYGTGDIDCEKASCNTIRVETCGTGDIEIKRLDCTSAYLETSGTGDSDIINIKSDFVEATTNGTGDIDLKGECRTARFSENGIGDIKSKGLKVTEKE